MNGAAWLPKPGLCTAWSEAVEPLFDASGTSAALTGQPMERIFRDLNMVRTHYMMNGDRTAENWGATFFGQEAYSLF